MLTTLLLFRFPTDVKTFLCSQKDTVPVDPYNLFEGKCFSNNGNQYEENATLTSCCECLRLKYYFEQTPKKFLLLDTLVNHLTDTKADNSTPGMFRSLKHVVLVAMVRQLLKWTQ